MKKIEVKRLNISQDNPEIFLTNMIGITYSKKLNTSENIEGDLFEIPKNTKTIDNVMQMNHRSIIEHVSATYLIKGASRSLLSQITRHRLFSFLSASQHYIDYSDFADFVVPIELEEKGPDAVKSYLEANKRALEEYKLMIQSGVDHSVARQILPNSMRNNLIMTGNLREWTNFMNLRLCNRNTSEIQYVAKLIKDDLQEVVPTISKYMNPDCVELGKCTQKHLYCGEYYTDDKCDEKYKILKKKVGKI